MSIAQPNHSKYHVLINGDDQVSICCDWSCYLCGLSFVDSSQDVVTRYASSTGHHVVRRFGWDCHGLPVEYEIDQKLGKPTYPTEFKSGDNATWRARCRIAWLLGW